MRKLGISTAVMLVLWAVVGLGSAQARLDPSFGEGGIAPVRTPLSVGIVREMAAAGDGSSYVLTENRRCGTTCSATDVLFRYTPEGVLDGGFGGATGFYELQQGEDGVLLAMSSNGQPLLAQAGADAMTIRRLTSTGELDPSFGAGGIVQLRCSCQSESTRVIPGPSGMLTVAIPGVPLGTMPHALTLVRLKANGQRDFRFGVGGTLILRDPPGESLGPAATTPTGGLILVGDDCCDRVHPIDLIRLSARGRFARRFARTTKHIIGALAKLHGYTTDASAVLVRPGRKLDLLGSTPAKRGFALRMNPSGHLHRGFGTGGVRLLPHQVTSAALGSDGSTLAVGDASVFGGGYAMRILAGGRLDPAFTPSRIPGYQGDSGISIVHQVGRKALLLDQGRHECRSSCIYNPRLIRYLELPARR